MARVYVLNKGSHNYSDARRFGDIHVVSDGLIPVSNVGLMYRMVQEAFKGASPDDYIVLSSLTSLCSVACASFAARFKRLNLLIWDGKSRYVERHMVFDPQLQLDKEK